MVERVSGGYFNLKNSKAAGKDSWDYWPNAIVNDPRLQR
jgi:hypothetical protein